MRMFKKSIVLLLIALILFPKTSDEAGKNSVVDKRYDDKDDQILCYSKHDKSGIVRCKSACVEKTIVSRYKIGSAYHYDFHYRVGCESITLTEQLKAISCNYTVSNGQNYDLNYMIKGNEARNPRLFVRKKCCFSTLCNIPHVKTRRNWIKRNQSMVSIMARKYGSQHLLIYLVITLVVSLFIYGVIQLIISWIRARKQAESGKKLRELDQDMIQESLFLESSIIDTKMEVTGRLNVKETAHLLAQLPDYDQIKYSRLKSMSNEESTKEMKTSKALTLVESELTIETKSARKVFLKPPLKTNAAGWGHNLWDTVRTINSPYDLLYRMIEHGPYQYPFTALELLTLFEETAFLMADEPSLLQIDPEVTVIGDIRGRYVDLHRWLQLTGWPPKNKILFLGGILDSDEPGSIECLALICSLKCRFPKNVYILRGEPEANPFRMTKRLSPVITNAVQSCIKRMCSQIPFAAVIGKSILVVYSGFSPMIREKGHIHHLFRPVTLENLTAVGRHIIFNQPSSQVRMYRPNQHGEHDWYGKQAVKRACKAMRCNVMIRGQSPVPHGYLPCWSNRLINLWSAPGYGSNYGAVLFISKELIITPILMEKQQT